MSPMGSRWCTQPPLPADLDQYDVTLPPALQGLTHNISYTYSWFMFLIALLDKMTSASAFLKLLKIKYIKGVEMPKKHEQKVCGTIAMYVLEFSFLSYFY